MYIQNEKRKSTTTAPNRNEKHDKKYVDFIDKRKKEQNNKTLKRSMGGVEQQGLINFTFDNL